MEAGKKETLIVGRHRTEAYIPKVYSRTVKWDYKTKSGELKSRKSKVHYIRWYDSEGKEHRRTTEFKFKSEADEYAHNLTEDDLRKDETTSAYKNFGEYAVLFFVDETCPILIRKRKRDENYQNPSYPKWTHGQVVKHIIKHLGHLTFEKITTQVVQDWLDNLPSNDKIRHNTANKQLSFLSMIFDEAVKANLVKTNPCTKVKRLSSDTKTKHAFTVKEMKTLFNPPWEDRLAYVACLTAGDTGCRISEVRALKPSKLLVQDNAILYDRSYCSAGKEKATKNKSSRVIPVSKAVMLELLSIAKNRSDDEYIFSYDGKNPIKPEQIYAALYKEMKNRDIDRFQYQKKDPDNELPMSFHSFRHSVDTILVENNVPPYMVRKFLGQTSPTCTQIYTDMDNIDLSKARKVMNEVQPIQTASVNVRPSNLSNC